MTVPADAEFPRPSASTLEANRLDELSTILEGLTQKILSYVKRADSKETGAVGVPQTPQELFKLFDIPQEGQGVEDLFNQFDQILDRSVVTWNQGFMDKLYASTNPVGVAADLLLSILNTNSHVFSKLKVVWEPRINSIVPR